MPPASSSRRPAWLVATLLAALGVAVWWQQRVAFDDAYISYRYAANWLAGEGLVFNPGERVEGFSNPLWVAAAAIGMRFGLDPFVATRALGVASFAVLLGLLGFALARAAAAAGLGARAGWLAPGLGALVLPYGLAACAGSGLETGFFELCLVGLGASLLLPDDARGVAPLRAGIAIAALLTRLDAAIALASALVAVSLVREADASRAKPAARALRALAVAAALGLAAIFAARRVYYGEWLPNPYWAKGADGFHWAAGGDYLLTFLRSSPQTGVLLALAAFAVERTLRAPALAGPALRRCAVYAALTVALYAVYAAKIGGDFMQYRFAWHVYPLLAGLGLFGLVQLARYSWPAASLLALAVALLSLSPPVLEHDYAMQSLAEMNAYTEDGRVIGSRMAELLPAGTRVATTLAGTISYYSGLPIIDQWGLNDRQVARGAPVGDFQRGHYKPATTAYLRERGVELVLNHPRLCPCDDPCTEDAAMLFLRIDRERCLQGFLLEPRRELLERACREPEHFVLRGIDCAALGVGPVAQAVAPFVRVAGGTGRDHR